jgi:hypothetical protein
MMRQPVENRDRVPQSVAISRAEIETNGTLCCHYGEAE